ncbi:Arv1-domain-containing protein [Macrolepiota fuliginosa MF-IS2]|uniref:Protein ARV n=1 Tax=Macrolepiota fuliginosa MF-IS2 TaxID=1400762 RepID=A0A9P6C5V6_9AGAR|nr:Arv1-domain-containing protein [Macrolepiota fuliginosa MF-IS2]
MPICTTCTTYTPYLYTVYESAYNLRLEQCKKCHTFADPYVEHDLLTLLLDLILLKRGVYRHLLYNRGARPRRALDDSRGKDKGEQYANPLMEEDATIEDSDTGYISRARWIWTLKLGAGLVILDAFIRWTHIHPKAIAEQPLSEDSLFIFSRVFFGCLAETLAFHTGILLSSFTILTILTLVKRLMPKFKLPFIKSMSRTKPPTTGREFHLSLIPLTLFYSSLTKLFLLFLLTIWIPISPVSSPSRPIEIPSDWLYQIISNPRAIIPTMISEFSRILDDDKIDREWVIRNILGGMSAGFGLRVILDMHPFFSTLIILSGWASKTAMAQLVGDWVGGNTETSQAWLAHSIP